MAKFRKKPVVIEAMQAAFDPESCRSCHGCAIEAWIRHGGGSASCDGRALHIGTLEGTMLADAGDWIIRGVKGEFYPCKPDIFEATYDAIEEADRATSHD